MPKEKKRSSIINVIGILVIFLILVVMKETGSLSNYIEGILIVCGIAIIMTAAQNIVVGYLGQIALGGCGFMAIGAYTAGLMTKAMENTGMLVGAGSYDMLRLLIAVLGGGVMAALFGILVGIPALRLKGDYLAIITLGFGEIIRVVIQNLKFCGGKGLSDGQAGQALIGISRLSGIYVVFWIMVVSIAVLYMFVRSKYGRAVIAIRDDEIAASASGLNVTYYKVLAFTVSAFFAGIAGAVYAHYLGSLNAASFGWAKSTEYVIMVVFGGMGSLSGSVIAAVSLSALPEVLRSFSEYRMLVYSIALILVMIFKPTGLLGTYEFSLTRLIDHIRSYRGGKGEEKKIGIVQEKQKQVLTQKRKREETVSDQKKQKEVEKKNKRSQESAEGKEIEGSSAYEGIDLGNKASWNQFWWS